jgi:hypothetical protein
MYIKKKVEGRNPQYTGSIHETPNLKKKENTYLEI